jgi:hypothetical protein
MDDAAYSSNIADGWAWWSMINRTCSGRGPDISAGRFHSHRHAGWWTRGHWAGDPANLTMPLARPLRSEIFGAAPSGFLTNTVEVSRTASTTTWAIAPPSHPGEYAPQYRGYYCREDIPWWYHHKVLAITADGDPLVATLVSDAGNAGLQLGWLLHLHV